MFEDEHHGHGQPETNTELAFRLHWTLVGLVAAAGCGGNQQWVFDGVAALSLIGPGLLWINRHAYDGKLKVLFWRTLVWMLPVWLALLTFAIGTRFPGYHLVNQGEKRTWELLPLPAEWVPIGGPIKTTAADVIISIGLFATALSALLMCNGRLVFARTWATLIMGAGVLAVLGFAQSISHAEGLLWAIPLQNPKFFSTFPHYAHWSAFALLWMSASFGLMAWLVRQRGWRWLTGVGWVLMLSTILLGVSVVISGDPLHLLLTEAVAGLGCFVMAWQTRVERAGRKRDGLSLGILLWIFLGLGLFATCAQTANRHSTEPWIKYANNNTSPDLHDRVIEDTQTMWHQREWLGWGHGSFRVVYSFFQGADQDSNYFAYARSDFWQSLAENGIIGTVVWWLPVLWVLARLAWQRRMATFLIAPLAGLASIVALSVVDFPFASPAVFFGFWLILFSLGRWSEVDDESTTSNLSEKRRIKSLRAQGKTTAPLTPNTSPTPAAPAV